MNECDEVLAAYRAQIAALEARARELRAAWSSTADTAHHEQAEQLDAEARALRLSMPDILRARFGRDVETQPEPESDDENDDD